MPYYSQKTLNKQDEIKYRVDYINSIPKVELTDKEIKIAKQLQVLKQSARFVNESNIPDKFKSKCGIISTKHDDINVYFGLLAELKVSIIYGGEELAKSWLNEQFRQINGIIESNIFDCTDVGHTQIRAIDYNPNQMMSIIIREKDLRTKSNQPVIGCVIDLNNKWIRICGWVSWDYIKNLPPELKYDPQGRGIAYWIPPYLLNKMDTFDKQFLY